MNAKSGWHTYTMMLAITRVNTTLRNRFTKNVFVSYFSRYPSKLAPLIMKNTGTAKMQMLWNSTSRCHSVSPEFAKTVVVQCSMTTAKHAMTFSKSIQ